MKHNAMSIAVLAAAGLVYGSAVAGKSKTDRLGAPSVIMERSGRFVVTPCAAKKCARGAERIRRKGKAHDFEKLRASMTRLRARYPKLPPLYLSAGPKVQWGEVVLAYHSAIRGSDGKPLFPVVFFTVAGK